MLETLLLSPTTEKYFSSFLAGAEPGHPGGRRPYPCNPVVVPEASPGDGGLRGGEGWRKVEADLQHTVERAQQPSHLRHVRLPG